MLKPPESGRLCVEALQIWGVGIQSFARCQLACPNREVGPLLPADVQVRKLDRSSLPRQAFVDLVCSGCPHACSSSPATPHASNRCYPTRALRACVPPCRASCLHPPDPVCACLRHTWCATRALPWATSPP